MMTESLHYRTRQIIAIKWKSKQILAHNAKQISVKEVIKVQRAKFIGCGLVSLKNVAVILVGCCCTYVNFTTRFKLDSLASLINDLRSYCR